MTTQEAYQLVFRQYPDVVTVEQMCEMMGGISQKTAYRLLRAGKVKCFLVGRRYRIPKISIFEYLNITDSPVV